MKYLSLFSGYGGFELGIQQAYEESLDNRGTASTSELATHSHQPDNNASDGNGWRSDPVCIGFSEIDKYAIQVYKQHYPYEQCEICLRNWQSKQETPTPDSSEQSISNATESPRPIGNINCDNVGGNTGEVSHNCKCKHKEYGDITKIDPKEIPEFDLLCGGVPCQSWSIAGKRGGFEDERGNMWFQFSRILREKQPKFFLAENVKGLLSHDGGKSMERICEELCDCGYAIDFEVLNSKNFGVPQSRERVFIIGIRLDLLDECQIF
jgi:site-specific DNA-cytosine methylase